MEDKQNAELFSKMVTAYDSKPQDVPTFFIGDYKPIVGFSEFMKE